VRSQVWQQVYAVAIGQAAVEHHSVECRRAECSAGLAQGGEAVDREIFTAKPLDQGSGEGIIILDQQQAQWLLSS
jgi:hypothetical protein